MKNSTSVAVILICTQRYRTLAEGLVDSVRSHLFRETPKTFVIFSDIEWSSQDLGLPVMSFNIPHLEWPYTTLLRFHYISSVRRNLSKFDMLVYIDADMLVEAPFSVHELPGSNFSFFGVQHPGYGPGEGTFEVNSQSEAYVDVHNSDISNYWQACFFGGRTSDFLDMAELLATRIERDLARGIVAMWHDESHLNRFFVDHKKQVFTLGPEFAWPGDPRRLWNGRPDGSVHVRIRHRDKDPGEFPQFQYHRGEVLSGPLPTPRRYRSAESSG